MITGFWGDLLYVADSNEHTLGTGSCEGGSEAKVPSMFCLGQITPESQYRFAQMRGKL